MQPSNKLKLSLLIAKSSFVIGTVLFVLQLIFNKNDSILIVGYHYVSLAIFVNLIYILLLIITLFENERIKETLKCIGIILLNIPIAIIYLTILIYSI